ncbi:right-handed parallel beta-helix repeat-containing protein [bacterium]|nr:right-handed parallel beta-helix repeat-containing protein [bacterium]
MRFNFLLMVLITVCFTVNIVPSFAEVINVPDDFETIQEAIDESEAGDTVLVQPGTYHVNIDFTGKDILLGSLFIITGDEAYIDSTMIDGDGDGSVVLFENGESEDAALIGFTVLNGSGDLWIAPDRQYYYVGGGIFCMEASPTITHCIIRDNNIEEERSRGGGIYCHASSAVISNCTIRGNSAISGGGIMCDSDVTIIDCIIIENSAEEGGGGGVYSEYENRIENCTISGNDATYGAGIFCYYGNASITNCSIENNTASMEGGGISCSMDGPVISECTIIGNSAGSYGGGGIYSSSCDPVIDNCIIQNNEARYGGGVYFTSSSGASIERCLIDNNISELTGGGIFCTRNSDITVTNCTVTRNESEHGGAIWIGTSSSPIIVNSILWDNSPQEIYYSEDAGAVVVTFTYSDISGGEDGIVTNDNGIIDWGDGNIDEDPQFADPDEGNYHLSEDSPCIDAGDPNSPEDPDETRADMGAFYFNQRRDSETLLVPQDYETIQDAIDASQDGDTVLVHPGTYVENIRYLGKDIVVGSLMLTTGDEAYIDSTIIDGNQSGSVVTFEERVTADAKLTGFTIQNGSGTDSGFEQFMGGGIFMTQSDAVIEHCRIRDNHVVTDFGPSLGGGIICFGWIEDTSPTIRDCEIYMNSSNGSGGGISIVAGCNPTIERVIIRDNSAEYGGGVSIVNDCIVTISHSVISENVAGEFGGGIQAELTSRVDLLNVTVVGNSSDEHGSGLFGNNGVQINAVNSIFWNNDQEEMNLWSACSVSVSYCDIEDGEEGIATNYNSGVDWGEGNIDSVPLFLDAENGDYHLTENSPCVDAGTAFFVWAEDTLINMTEDEYHGNAPDMGAFESEFTDAPPEIFILHPSSFILFPPYPNPFNPRTRISFNLPANGLTRLTVYDVNGRLVDTILEGNPATAGWHFTEWDAGQFPPGSYFIHLENGSRTVVRKVMLIK